MSESKHTPGPWHLLSGEGDMFHLSTSVGPNWCGDDTYIGNIIVCKADARLIAAAPRLLEAAKEAEECWSGRRVLDAMESRRRMLELRAAIAEAEGSDSTR